MGGPGSGVWTRSTTKKPTTDACRALDVRLWQQKGLLRPGYAGRWVWQRDGVEAASVGFTVLGPAGAVQAAAVQLSYTLTASGQPSEDIRYSVPLAWTRCNYGGARPWFRCPSVVRGRHCDRRAALLYCLDRYFVCRCCHGLAYESQREDDAGRARIQLQALRVRLGGSPNLFTDFPRKPRNMRWSRYWKLRQHALDLEERYYAGMLRGLQGTHAFLQRMEARSKTGKPQRRR